MTGTRSAVGVGTVALAALALAALAAVALALLTLLARRRSRPRGRQRAEIVSLADSTTEDRRTGAVRSVQKADLLIDADALEEIWTPEYLERLARTYWRYLTRVTFGLIRVHYSEEERAVVLVTEPLRLLTFQAPEYEIDPLRGLVRWRIERGLLVSRCGRDGHGYLQIEVQREAPPDVSVGRERADPVRERLHVEVEVANFYPSIALGISRRIYNATQSRIHVIVTYGFLRSLARLDLAESRVGRLRVQ
jgi:hypothetical protein